MAVFSSVTKSHLTKYWEPVFICDHEAPLYNEQLTWEGRKDKMVQGLELCLSGYKFLVLNIGFLVHKGIKSHGDEKKHIHAIREQQAKLFYRIIPEIHRRLGQRAGCSRRGV